MTEDELEHIRSVIVSAFQDVPFPEWSLGQCRMLDDNIQDGKLLAEQRETEVLADWREIDREFLWSLWGAFSWLEADGVRFYLPAYLMLAVDDDKAFRTKIASQVIDLLKPPGVLVRGVRDHGAFASNFRRFSHEYGRLRRPEWEKKFGILSQAQRSAVNEFLELFVTSGDRESLREAARDAWMDPFWRD
jgi:hypothetical protein